MISRIEEIVREASSIMLQQGPGQVDSKEGHANFVTQADINTQHFLQKELLALLPGSQLYGEEKENQQLTDQPTWVVDPIDGTLNYIHGLGHSAISVALAENKQLQLGVIYNPYRQEMFSAQKGQGAALNGKPMACADTPFNKALAFFGTSPYDDKKVNATFQAVQLMMKKTADVRRFGSAALDLAYVACGRADIFFEFALSPWDYAAGLLLVREAGGQMELMNIQGEQLDVSRTAAVIAANPRCFEEAANLIRPIYQSIKEGA